MEIFHNVPHINFMKYRHLLVGLSFLLFGISAYLLWTIGPKMLGVDFLGGAEIVVQFENATDPAAVRTALEKGGIVDATVQSFQEAQSTDGSNKQFSVRMKVEGGINAKSQVASAINSANLGKFEVIKDEEVGPVVGKQIAYDGIKALIWGMIGIGIYISVRFEWPYALGAVVALIHDAVIVGGAHVYSGRELNGPIIASILTIIGYSVNDSVIVFDRVRENIDKLYKREGKKAAGKKAISFYELIDLSINQTLSRTMLTSMTILLSAVMLWQIGRGSVSELGFDFTVGTIIGTYSSIFCACPLVAFFRRFQAGNDESVVKQAA